MKLLLWLIALALSFPVFANWQLDNQASVVSFTTFKKQHIGENHRFHGVSAKVDEQGKISLSIDLASVDTKIAIRDQRMKAHLFNVDVFPSATFNGEFDAKILTTLAPGDSKKLTIAGEINIHGHTQSVNVFVLVTKSANNKLVVASLEPLLISAQAFDLVSGINSLMELAKLPSITHTVPVSFVLSFTRQ